MNLWPSSAKEYMRAEALKVFPRFGARSFVATVIAC